MKEWMKKRLFFDMDGVLVDFQSGLDRIDEETAVRTVTASSRANGFSLSQNNSQIGMLLWNI